MQLRNAPVLNADNAILTLIFFFLVKQIGFRYKSASTLDNWLCKLNYFILFLIPEIKLVTVCLLGRHLGYSVKPKINVLLISGDNTHLKHFVIRTRQQRTHTS